MGCPHCSASVAAVSYILPFSEWVFLVVTLPLPHHHMLLLESKSPLSATSRPPHQPEVLDSEWRQWLDGTLDCVPWGGCKCDPCLGGRVTIYGDQMGILRQRQCYVFAKLISFSSWAHSPASLNQQGHSTEFWPKEYGQKLMYIYRPCPLNLWHNFLLPFSFSIATWMSTARKNFRVPHWRWEILYQLGSLKDWMEKSTPSLQFPSNTQWTTQEFL